MAKFDPVQIRNPSTDNPGAKFRAIRPLGASQQMGEINENFSPIYILYTFFIDRPTGQTARRIFTRDGSDNAASRKGQTFLGTKIRS